MCSKPRARPIDRGEADAAAGREAWVESLGTGAELPPSRFPSRAGVGLRHIDRKCATKKLVSSCWERC